MIFYSNNYFVQYLNKNKQSKIFGARQDLRNQTEMAISLLTDKETEINPGKVLHSRLNN